MRHTYPSTAASAPTRMQRAAPGCPYGRGGSRRNGTSGCLPVDGSSATAMSAAGRENAAPFRRDSGVTWLNRQRAKAVRLGHPLLDVVVPDSGLRSGELLVLCGTARSGKTETAQHIAARHAASGGAVVWVGAPGAGGVLRGRRMLMHIETAVREQRTACGGRDGGGAGGSAEAAPHEAAEVEAAVSSAAARVSFTACASVDDLRDVLTAASPTLFPPPAVVSTTAAPCHTNGEACDAASAAAQRRHCDTMTPLLVVDGLGATQYVALYERVRCQETPLLQWVAAAVQQSHCAVLLTDATYAPFTAAAPNSCQPTGVPVTMAAKSPSEAPDAMLYGAHTIRVFGQQQLQRQWRGTNNNHGSIGGGGAPLSIKVIMVLQRVPLPTPVAHHHHPLTAGGSPVVPTEAIAAAVYEHHNGRLAVGAPLKPQFSHKAAVAFLVAPEGLRAV